ncbi:MAG: DeoR/GlpR transcriptional regulator [Clostridia bacterium]|nr:DeoR/GlpR transcriptional regulator [Clostridia bacterium]
MNSRQKEIVMIAQTMGEVTIKELASRLKVSEMTIHRDVDALQAQRYVYKKRGAVVFVDVPDREKVDFYEGEKREIGIKAASLISEGQSIVFDNSTTALECAKFLDASQKHTFYTTNLETSAVLSKYDKGILYCSGGYFFPESNGFVGTQAESFVSSVKADVCIFGTGGLSIEEGMTTPYPMHTALQRAIINSAKTRILVCDHSKFGKVAMEKVAELGSIDIIVTDSGLSDEIFEEYSKYVKIIR